MVNYEFSFFDKLKDTKPTKLTITMDDFDRMIRSNEMKAKIEAYRQTKDKTLKEQLPLVTFSGIFNRRKKADLVQHSKLICLDIDKIPYPHELKNELKKVEFIHYMFISPSNDGLKIVIRIEADNETEHKQYFTALKQYFTKIKVELDIACKDIGRACFVSYDPTAYYNIESTILNFEWIKNYLPIEDKQIEKTSTKNEGTNVDVLMDTVKVDLNVKKVIKKAVKRFMNAKDGEKHTVLRNQSVHLGYYCNAGHCDYTTCYKALEKAVNERKTELENFNQALETIKKGILWGIENPKPIDNLKVKTKDYQFWFAYKGKVSIRTTTFFTYLNRNGYWTLIYNNNRMLVKVDNNVVKLINKADIIDFVMDKIRNLELDIGDGCTKYDLKEKFHNNLSKLLSENQLLTFERIDATFLKDTKDVSYIFYRNGILKITDSNKELLKYSSVKGLIWETSINHRDYNPTEQHLSNYSEKGDFCNFIKGVSGERQANKKFSRYESMKTILGYLIHGYKDPKLTRSVIFCDEQMSENPEGGTGKGIVCKSIQFFKKVTTIDGKNFSFGRTFAFQQVDLDTKILSFDDVKMKFDFNKLFSIITEGIAVEKKNKDTLYIPYEDAPKVLITTNYMISGEGNSNERRRIEIEFSQHYNGANTPYDEFGKTLFKDWDNNQWQYFDVFMTNCVQLYLKEGIVEPLSVNIPLRKLRQETSEEFAMFAKSKLNKLETNGREYNVKAILGKFIKDYEEYEDYNWFTNKRFNKWLKQYGSFFGYITEFRYSNNIQYVSFNLKKRLQI